MKNIILDTSYIFSFADEDDSNYNSAQSIFENQKGSIKYLVPFIVVAELVIGSDNFDFLTLIKAFSKRFIQNNEDDLNFIKKIPSKLARSLKSNDCLILALCKRYDADLITFDKNLLKAYDKVIRD